MPTAFCKGTNIGRIIESLPAEEAEHMCRVGRLVGIMAAKLCVRSFCPRDSTREGYKYFGEAAFYHDIGKVWVPQKLLTKPGKLTAEEVIVMHKHPVFARELFDLINDGCISGIPKHLIKPAFDSAVYHHEWWNGKGYPYGIGSENIPLIARITSLCDAYDAITSKRAYRNARTHYYACREMEANAGTQFDPALVQVFLDNEAEFTVHLNTMISSL